MGNVYGKQVQSIKKRENYYGKLLGVYIFCFKGNRNEYPEKCDVVRDEYNKGIS